MDGSELSGVPDPANDGRRFKARVLAIVAGCLLAAVWLSAAPARALAACGNPVQCENQLPGDPASDWAVNGIGDASIQGFATQFSVNAGQTVSFKIKTPSANYHIDILRLGYYGGAGARKIAAGIKPTASLPQTQPACQTTAATGLIDCGNWGVSASWVVPSTAVSGMYIAHLVRDDASDPGGDSQIPFVVRNDSSHSDIVLATSDATWQAYNDYGGNSLYTCTVACPPGDPLAYKAAYSVSYNRPFDGAFQTDGGASYLYYAEYQMIRFLEENGYDVSYVSDSDLDASGALLLNHKIFMSSGHDEYWSGNEVTNVKAALAAGVNLTFFSGNEIFWKTRWGPSQDGSNTPYRTLTTYKETHFNAPTDPSDPPTWTGAWADPRFSPPADGGYPANALSGQEFLVNAGSGDITVPSQYSQLRFWRNTPVARLASGTSLTLGKGDNTLGYEWDADTDNGWRPAGEFDLSSTTLSGVQPFVDYGSTTGTGTATHNLSLYRARSGALVFGAGTVQWAWGLDDTNGWGAAGPPTGSAPDPTMQQATVNLFADMGAQPTTLLSGLTTATQSIDGAPPTSTITSPSVGANLSDGSPVTVTGTATDAGGGVVAGVEVSADGGKTWHPAALATPAQAAVNWTYTWNAHGAPSATIETRAVDDSGNLETPTDATPVNVGCPCSIWGNSVTPATAVPGDPSSQNDSGDPLAVTVGVKFTSDTFGQVSGIRFYKASANTGTHVGSVWTAGGQLLASATFTSETASGWQTATFSSPVTVLPGTTYVAGYFAPNGHYSSTPDYFYNAPAPTPLGGAALNSPPLHAVPNATDANGLFSYGSTSTFPSNTSNASNYWVDVVFSPSPAPGQVTGTHATAGNGSVFVTWSAPSTGGPATTYTVTPYIGTSAQTPTTVSGTPAPTGAAITGLTSGTSYTFTVTANNPNGSGPPSAASNSVVPTFASSTPSFVQQVTGHGNAASLSVTPAASLTVGNRMVVLVGVWSNAAATASSVTDSAGDTYVELAHWTASDSTEMSVWSAPIWSGGGTRPTITVKPSASADLGVAASEYSGLATSNDASVVDQTARATGTTGSAATVASGATAASSADNELAIGVYADSGFGDTLTAGSGWTQRSNISNTGDMELVSEDQVLATAGAKPSATVGTGANTTWQAATVVLKPASTVPTPPGPPTGVSATAGNGTATVRWTPPSNGGSPITSYTVTPFIGSQAQLPTTITGSPPSTSTTISGLTNGTAYTFTVTASNMIGTGPASSPSSAVTPTAPTAPAAPTGVSATSGNGTAAVSWTAPSNGGSPITSYTVTPFIGSQAQLPTTITGSPPSTSTTISGLTNGTAYTFTVAATNSVNTGPASSPSNAVTPTAPTAPAAPTGVSATAGNGTAGVSWTAPSNGGSPITGYTITPFIGSQAQTATTITGTPPSTSTTVSGLTNGTAYTFTVAATNNIGTGPASSPSNAVTPTASTAPAFVQQVTAHKNATSVSVIPTSSITAGNRIIVLVGVWSSGAATAKSVTDSAGDTYVELQHFKASDNTELSVWSAPVTAGGGTKPTIVATPTAKADVGVAALEYSGLSTAAGLAAVDQSHQGTGTTAAAGTVSSGATPAVSDANELALGLYVDSGFSDTLTAGTGFTSRANVSKVSDMELLAEDQLPATGATPNASVGTGANTTWLMSTIVFKHG